MFKVGDLVTAKEYSLYAVTDKGKPCEVVEIGQSRIRVKCLWGGEDKFWVFPDKFRPMSEAEIFNPGQKLIVNSVIGGLHTEIATFMEYKDYGVRVRDSEGSYITLSTHSVKGVVKGGLHV